MGYSLKNVNQRKYAYFLFCVIIFDYLLFPLPIFAANQDYSDAQCVPESLGTDKTVNQTLIVENTIKASENAEKSEVTKSLVPDNLKKVRAATFTKTNRVDDLVDVQDDINMSIVSSSSAIDHGYHSMTAYTSEAAQTDASPCVTANGFNVCEHGVEDTVAANFLPFGTKVKMPEMFGERVFVVRDRMNRRYSQRVDVWFKEKPAAMQFGVRTLRVVVVK